MLERTKTALVDGVTHILHRDISEVAGEADEAAHVLKDHDLDSATRAAPEVDSSAGHGALQGRDAPGGRLTATEIRRLTTDEWQVNRYFGLKHVGRNPLDFRSSRADMEKKTEQDYRKDFDTIESFVAFHADEPIGRVRLVATDNPQVREMAAVNVDPTARGTGTSDSLIQTALKWAKNNNCAAVNLWVRDNNDHAKNLYLRNGFEFTGEAKPHWADDSLRLDQMRHDLS